jgi:FkbM family methyltransferase
MLDTAGLIDILEGKTLFKRQKYALLSSFNELDTKEIYLYGLGESAHWFLEIGIKKYSIYPKACFDLKLKKESLWEGIKAFPSTELYNINLKPTTKIIVCSGSYKKFQEIIEGFPEISPNYFAHISDFYEFHNFFIEEETISKNISCDTREEIIDAFNLLQDDLSKQIYARLLQIHINKISVAIPTSHRREQYLPEDLGDGFPYVNGYLVCGAYDGDFIRTLNLSKGKIQKLIALEPDPHSFARLIEYGRKNQSRLATETSFLQMAISQSKGFGAFKTNHGLGSKLSSDGDIVVETTSIDAILINEPSISHVCMDIEGEEYKAILGAENSVVKGNLTLCICLYHRPSHLWKIINLIQHYNSKYKFFIRNYTSFATETVLYATNK